MLEIRGTARGKASSSFELYNESLPNVRTFNGPRLVRGCAEGQMEGVLHEVAAHVVCDVSLDDRGVNLASELWVEGRRGGRRDEFFSNGEPCLKFRHCLS